MSTLWQSPRTHRWLTQSLLVSIVGYLYLTTLSPGAYWLDSSEFVAGAHTLGVVHPPGHPLYVLLAKGWALLIPVGHIGFRMALFSAALGIGCAWFVASLVRQLAATDEHETIAHQWCGAAAGWLFAMTQACWMQSVRAEVYTLNAFMVLAGLWLIIRWTRDRHAQWLTMFAVLTGLALANHHYLVFFFLPAPMIVVLLDDRGRQFLRSRAFLKACMMVLLALTAYAYLPIRAATDPVINWGDPTTWTRFYDVLSGKTFQGSVGDQATGLLSDNLGVALGMFAEQFTLPGLLFALLALFLLLFRNRPVGLLLLLAFVLNMLTKSIMTIDPNNPDDYGYFLFGVGILAVALGWLGAQCFRSNAKSAAWGMAGTLSIVLLIGLGWHQMRTHRAAVDLSKERSASVLTSAVLDSVPNDSVVLIQYYSFFFNHWYAQLVEGQRPDVAVVQATFDSKRYDGKPYIAAIRKQWPVLDPVLDEVQTTPSFPRAALQTLAEKHPVYIEPLIEGVLQPEHRTSVGMVRRLCGRTPCKPRDALREDGEYWAPIERILMAPGAIGADGRKLLTWFHFVHAAEALKEGNAALALQVITRSQRLGSPSNALSRLAEHANELQTLTRNASIAGGHRKDSAEEQKNQKARQLREMNYIELL